jgi:predicted nucleic acid-binding protein
MRAAAVDRDRFQYSGVLGAGGFALASTLRVLSEERGYLEQLRNVTVGGKVRGPQIHDARVAALCRQHGVSVLWTAGRDFSRFKGFRTVNPMLKQSRE